MSTGMRVRMATIRMRRKKHRKPMMDQRRIWRTEGIVLESVKIGKYISTCKIQKCRSKCNGKPCIRSEDCIAISDKISKLNINESVACGYRPKKGINIARRCVNGYCITATPAKSVIYMLF
jgi:hypothetical protein